MVVELDGGCVLTLVLVFLLRVPPKIENLTPGGLRFPRQWYLMNSASSTQSTCTQWEEDPSNLVFPGLRGVIWVWQQQIHQPLGHLAIFHLNFISIWRYKARRNHFRSHITCSCHGCWVTGGLGWERVLGGGEAAANGQSCRARGELFGCGNNKSINNLVI